MISWLNQLLNRTRKQRFPVVWDTQLPSIYRRLKPTWRQPRPLAWDNNLVEGLPLGDSDETFWAPGAFDGTMINYLGITPNGPGAEQILPALQQVLAEPSVDNMQQLYALIHQDSPLHYINDLLKAIPETPGLRADRLNELAWFLCTQSPDSYAVKFAMTIMYFFPNHHRNIKILRVMARHDEFTCYAVIALRSVMSPKHYRDIWFSMAQRVDGWGRIYLINQLPAALKPTLHHWLLREGFVNSVMKEYTAIHCAFHGRLRAALATEHDDALLSGTAEILYALLNKDSRFGIAQYEDGEQCCLSYLHHLLALRPADPRHYLTAKRIGEWALRETSLETTQREQLTALSTEVLALPIWDEVIDQPMTGKVDYRFNLVIEVAHDKQKDPFPVLFERQRNQPESALWYALMQTENPEQVTQICRLAEIQFDLISHGSGPVLSHGPAAQWQAHCQLDFILQALKRFPQLGWPLLKTALHSPVIRNRQMAMNTLEAWPPESLAIYGNDLAECLATESYPQLQERLKKLYDPIHQDNAL